MALIELIACALWLAGLLLLWVAVIRPGRIAHSLASLDQRVRDVINLGMDSAREMDKMRNP